MPLQPVTRTSYGGFLSLVSYIVALIFLVLAFYSEVIFSLSQIREFILGVALVVLAFILERLGV